MIEKLVSKNQFQINHASHLKSFCMYFFSMSASSFKKNLEKSYILGKLVKLHAWMKEYFSVILYSYDFFFSFQRKLHQSTNAYNCHGNDSTVGRSGCSNPDESFGYYDSNDVVVVI